MTPTITKLQADRSHTLLFSQNISRHRTKYDCNTLQLFFWRKGQFCPQAESSFSERRDRGALLPPPRMDRRAVYRAALMANGSPRKPFLICAPRSTHKTASDRAFGKWARDRTNVWPPLTRRCLGRQAREGKIVAARRTYTRFLRGKSWRSPPLTAQSRATALKPCPRRDETKIGGLQGE